MNNLEALTAVPMCCENKMILEKEPVDIGVGIQYFPMGYYCEMCGNTIAICSGCAVPLDGRAHWAWCDTNDNSVTGLDGQGAS